MTLNSDEFDQFKRFILELKKLNLEYIKFKENGKTINGEAKSFEEFISISLERLNQSNFIQKESNMLESKNGVELNS